MTGVELSELQNSQLARLAEWSVGLEIAGTAVTDVAEAMKIHVADSLAGVDVPQLQTAGRLADIGSGAGFPGLVLAVALPGLNVTLVDSVRKKMEVAARIAAELELDNLECVWGRAEEIAAVGSEHRDSYDVVTARALADLGVLVEYAAPLLRVGGSLVAWKADMSDAESAGADSAAKALGFGARESLEYRPFPESRHRRLIVTQKQEPTPERFPRRPGVALKRPL